MLIIQLLLLSIPILFWKDIKNEAIKFSMALFILVFYGYSFFRIMEGYIKNSIDGGSNDKYKWVGVIGQLFILIMFYIYSKRVLEMLS
jgi:hypothetical protein